MKDKSEINEVVLEALTIMKPKIKKVLNKTASQEQEDLEQDINLRIIRAVKDGRIRPVTFWGFKENFDKR
ncbi:MULTISPECIES: hypothetical protein [Allobacillus]|uniref:Helix-turn-helix conjugative transposon-like domain-containing protein n=1 Tax=Allobacillus salarius TaxID=1955272 RepID=A0A556P8S9_9BACI|nr:hypothetical protein [Allobacillus salarius]TSJ60791.1 hypothetical protein FPQ13_11555 [Allobacillus salarius]